MASKLKIYLCDFVHNYVGSATYMFPLNISYLVSYANQYFNKEVDIRLFKYPDDFIAQFKEDAPDVAGFSHYTWNSDLDSKFSEWVKALSAKTIVVFGGPNINHSLLGYKSFFINHDAVDFYIPYQGETPFINLLKEVFRHNLDLGRIKSKPIDGVTFLRKDSGLLVQGKATPNIKDLDSIASPYLSGILDKFFDTRLIPIMETNRGCPYTCTFCAQGVSSHHRLDFFSMERVKEEVSYIASRVKNTNIMNFADSNFGIADRDLEIAQFLARTRLKTGYPHKFNTNWAKNQPRLFEIAKILTNCVLTVSLQSLDQAVLENVKRTNIQLPVFKDIINKINVAGGISGTEIILGLPGETKESHLQTLRQLFDWDVSYMICYNALILEGTEMSIARENGRFQGQTKFRLIDSSFGRYDTVTSFEYEEGIRSTPTISEEEILFFRPIHCLIQFLWNYRFYFDLLKYLQSLGVNPLDYIAKFVEDVGNAPLDAKMKNIFKEFQRNAKREWFNSPKELRDYYIKPGQFDLIRDGQYGKLNGKYIFKILQEARPDFEKSLYETFISYSEACCSKGEIAKDILKFLSASIIDFSRNWDDLFGEVKITCKYDILKWRESRHKKPLDEFYSPEGIKFRFYLPDEQKEAIKIVLKQYEHNNKNLTLRKMSEWMDIKDFFYRAEPV